MNNGHHMTKTYRTHLCSTKITHRSITSIAITYQDLPNDPRDKQQQLPDNIMYVDAQRGHIVPGEDLRRRGR